MKSFIAVLALVAVAAADVSHLRHVNHASEQDAETLRNENDVSHNGFKYAFETSNGISAQQNGVLTNPGSENAAVASEGSHSYTSPDGQVITLRFIADANGYQPQGEHLPTPPPTQAIPDYILRSIAYNAAHAPKNP